MRALPFALALAIAVSLAPAAAQKKTICTVTVNSADEKEAMRARLPKGDYEFHCTPHEALGMKGKLTVQ